VRYEGSNCTCITLVMDIGNKGEKRRFFWYTVVSGLGVMVRTYKSQWLSDDM